MEDKISILLLPQQLAKNTGIVKIQHIIKSGKVFRTVTNDPDASEVNRCFPHLPKQAKDVLVQFSDMHSELRNAGIRAKFKSGRAGVSFNEFYEQAVLRLLHEMFERLKPFASLVKWHHSLWQTNNKVKTAPCIFSPFKPIPEFEVVKVGRTLAVKVKLKINDTAYSLEDFERCRFLLCSNNEYFLLSFKDYQTLEWLTEVNPTQYARDATALAQQVLAPLELDYKVNRNGHFTQHQIEGPPVNRVMLSEISNSFLVLTPQWMYEGFLIDGPWKPTYEITKAGEAYVIHRDKAAEDGFTRMLEGLHPNFKKQLNGYFYLPFADAQKKQWFLKAYHALLEQDIQIVGMDMLRHFRYSAYKVETIATIKEQTGKNIQLNLKVSFGKEEIALTELQKLLLTGQRSLLLKDGSLGVLTDEWLATYGPLFKHGKLQKNEIALSPGMAIASATPGQQPGILSAAIKPEWWKRWQQWQQPDAIGFPVPADVKATLRPYQQKGFEWLVLLAEVGAGACLADDMGLGKTLQAICFLAHQVAAHPAVKHLVICPSSLLYNWEQELAKFTPHLSTTVYHGPQRSFETMCKGDHQVIITTYGTLRSDIEQMAAISFGVAVLDESHNIKNPSALITRAVNQINASTRVALSGTPVMNNTFDLYAQLSFLLPGMFGSREFFKREYADAIDRDQDPVKIKALQKITAPFILRRTKEQVATDLPEKIETVLWCTMGAAQRTAYNTIKENVRASILIDIKENGLNSGKLTVINGLLKLRQVCNSPKLIKGEEQLPGDSIKTDILVAELKNLITNHKALVFSQFTSMLDLIESDFAEAGIPYCRLDGTTPITQRQQLVNSFQKADSLERVFLISLKAGNAGLNLTAADYVFLIDPWWNTAVQQQAIDRTHRIGQTNNVFAYKMICKDTIEEKILQLQQRKKKLADELVGEEDGFVKALSEEDIDFLFS